ncbi:MAG: phospholipase D family protein, partial [Candidatus Geothermarchaeales archaeon]
MAYEDTKLKKAVSEATRLDRAGGVDGSDLSSRIEPRIVRGTKDLNHLFSGFTGLRGITYVADPELVLGLFERYRYEGVDVLLGEVLAGELKDTLSQKAIEVIAKLAELVERGSLRIYVPKKGTIHSKLYVLEGPDFVRIIQGSLNLQPSRSVNYVWTLDLDPDDPFLEVVRRDYREHLRHCSLFMEDLIELFHDHPQMDRHQLIRTWLEGESLDTGEEEVRGFYQEATVRSLRAAARNETSFVLRLPETSRARKGVQRVLRPLRPLTKEDGIELDAQSYLNFVERRIGVPAMYVDLERGAVFLGIRGEVKSMNEPLPEPHVVDEALAHLEAYLNTVEWGEADQPEFVKAAMMEALLYIFAAPFLHEYMRVKRERVGPVDRRGPRFLYIYGPSQNGKTTFLRFALKLLTGEDVHPLSQADLTKDKVRLVQELATVFPLIFDDVALSRRPAFEDIAKGYWERWWRADHLQPQIILTSNDYRLKDWAKTRVKQVDFDVFFPPDEMKKEKLARLLTTKNPVYSWFTHLYIEEMRAYLVGREELSKDELFIARRVMQKLYAHAGRSIPGWLSDRPLEEIYDPGRREWRNLFRLKKASARKDRGRFIVTFATDMVAREVREYRSHLPAELKVEQK